MYRLFILILLISFSTFSFAALQQIGDVSFTVKNEWREDDQIQSLGIEALTFIDSTPIGFAFSSSFAYADVAVKDSVRREDYVAWDTGVKFGYFGQLFAYAEFGVDLFDMILQDLSGKDFKYDDNRWNEYDDSHNNNIDGYLGFGIGLNAAPFKIEAFARARQIDGDDWRAENVWFSGVQVSVSFP